jgi:dTDP-4-dehydrorhamnose 3,5-epimerase
VIVSKTTLSGVRVIDPRVFPEPRGWTFESWNAARYAAEGIPTVFVQDNVSYSLAGVLRGLHFQHPNDQAKLVSVLEGEIYGSSREGRRSSRTR